MRRDRKVMAVSEDMPCVASMLSNSVLHKEDTRHIKQKSTQRVPFVLIKAFLNRTQKQKNLHMHEILGFFKDILRTRPAAPLQWYHTLCYIHIVLNKYSAQMDCKYRV